MTEELNSIVEVVDPRKPCKHCGKIVPLNDLALSFHNEGFCVDRRLKMSLAEKIVWGCVLAILFYGIVELSRFLTHYYAP